MRLHLRRMGARWQAALYWMRKHRLHRLPDVPGQLAWLLTGGVWNDGGQWIDTAEWEDGA